MNVKELKEFLKDIDDCNEIIVLDSSVDYYAIKDIEIGHDSESENVFIII